jgi:hypothetical protein
MAKTRTYNYFPQRLLLCHFPTIIDLIVSALVFLTWPRNKSRLLKKIGSLSVPLNFDSIGFSFPFAFAHSKPKLNNSGEISCPYLRTFLNVTSTGKILTEKQFTPFFI